MKWTQRALIGALLMIPVIGCECDADPIFNIPPPEDQIDVFDQKQAAEVDILWVIDNSESMAAEQQKISDRFAEFFSQLIISEVDYHIGVVTTDPADFGVLRQYDGSDVPGCDQCRFITNEVGCANPAVSVVGLDDAQAESTLASECQAQLVFRRLVRAGINGSSFEEGFTSAASALGGGTVDATGFPTGEIPTENNGFLRQNASLFVIFVSDEDEGAKQDGSPIRYYQRLFESLKGAGNENLVSVSAIVGWPLEGAPDIAEVCGILETTFDGVQSTDDPRASLVKEIMTTQGIGCFDEGGTGDPSDAAETGGRYIELACRTGGVITNMCQSDYSTALDQLGANAAGLLRRFDISAPDDIKAGPDCVPLSGDESLEDVLDCDDDGEKNLDDGFDNTICVRAVGIDDPLPETPEDYPLVPNDPVNGWVYESTTNSIRFNGSFIPKPGSQVFLQYARFGPAENNPCANQ
jgi:hypothetical protein